MYRGSSASRIWLGSCSNCMTPSKPATSVSTVSDLTANRPSSEVSVNTISCAASTHSPFTSQISPSLDRGSRVWMEGSARIRDTKGEATSSTLSTSCRRTPSTPRRQSPAPPRLGRLAHREGLHEVVLGAALEVRRALLADGHELRLTPRLQLGDALLRLLDDEVVEPTAQAAVAGAGSSAPSSRGAPRTDARPRLAREARVDGEEHLHERLGERARVDDGVLRGAPSPPRASSPR